MRRQTLVLALLVAATGSVLPAPVRADQAPTSTNEVKVWNVSLRLVRGESYPADLDWTQAFKQMANHPVRPDVISILEAPWPKRENVMNVLTANLGGTWGYAHVDANTTTCTGSLTDEQRVKQCGNTMIAFNTARFSNTCGTCITMRWPAYDVNSTGTCTTANRNKDQIATRLRDALEGKIVTVVSLHIPNQETSCLAMNLKDTNDRLEDPNTVWKDRPLTIFTGDLNEHPDPTHDDKDLSQQTDAEIAGWRREAKLACWYVRFSMHHGGDECTLALSGTWTFPYHDVAWVHNSASERDICDQWTLGNNFPATQLERQAADSCEDVDPSGKKRIDFMWVRFEKASTGTAIVVSDDPSTTTNEAKQYSAWHVPEGGVDRGYYDPTPLLAHSGDESKPYSDHRALFARIVWCPPEAATAGYATPCSTS